jgi:hypothetical protein
MGQRVFQVAKELGIDSKLIVGKLIREELPPPPADRDREGRTKPWSHLSVVSMGLKDMIRQWHAAGELVLPGGGSAESEGAEKPRRKQRRRSAARFAADLQSPLPPVDLSSAPDHTVARQALEAVAQIDQDAQKKKHAQVEGLRESRRAILGQLKDVQRQVAEIDAILAAITGQPAAAPARAGRRDLSDVRERMGRWLEARPGEKFNAGALAREFPELGNTAVSYLLKPLVEAGRIQTDASEGIKRPKYFAPAGAAAGV